VFLELKLTLRFLRMRRRGLARFTASAAVIGIAAGVLSLIVAQAVARGFQSEMQEKILANTPHISIFMNDGGKMADWQTISKQIEMTENVETLSASDHESALLAGPQTTAYGVLRVQMPKDGVENSEEIEVSIGAELARMTGNVEGSMAEIITFANGELPKTSSVRVNNIFRTGLYDYDSTWINISPDNFARLFDDPAFMPAVLFVTVKDIYNSDLTARAIRGMLDTRFRVIDWQEANRPLFAALSLERKAALIVISLIIFIAALNITTTLALLVNERRLDIAVLRTCGIKAKSLVSIFLLEGLFLGLIGVVSGVILGLLFCFLGNYFRVINLSAEVYALSYIPLRPAFADTLIVILVSLALCVLATLYPAIKASRNRPLENLRNQ